MKKDISQKKSHIIHHHHGGSSRKWLYILVATNILSFLFILNVSFFSDLGSSRKLSQSLDAKGKLWDTTTKVRTSTNQTYKFEDPVLAFKILTVLDTFVPVPDHHFMARSKSKIHYDEPFFGLKNDDDYCTKARAYFVENPMSVFTELNFITSSSTQGITRSIALANIGNDIMPHIGPHMKGKEKNDFVYDISPAANIFFASKSFGAAKHIGKHFACLNQAVSDIPGHIVISRKDTAAESAIAYAEKFKTRPQCFNHDKFFPETWILYDKESCEDFFRIFNSEEYQRLKAERNIVYIRKVGAGSHRGNGVFPVTDDEESYLRTLYKNGAKCGEVDKNYILQHYVHDPLLLEGRKFDFRMYMLVASTNPLMAFYHDGFLRVSLGKYESNSTDKKVLLTNLALNKEIYEEVQEGNLFNGLDEEGLKEHQQWSFDRLQAELLRTGVINDTNWLDNYLRPEFKKAMIHLIKMASDRFLKRSTTYQLYGVDFLLDSKLQLWFIEANSGPALGGYYKEMEKFIVKMIEDHFKIIMGLTRSRMHRVVLYVNKLIQTGEAVMDGDRLSINNLSQRREEFRQLTMNYFEKEFEPTPDNGFSKIIDENLQGTARFSGLIGKECL